MNKDLESIGAGKVIALPPDEIRSEVIESRGKEEASLIGE